MKKILLALVLVNLLALPVIGLAACSDYLSQSQCESAKCTWLVDKNECMGVEETDVMEALSIIANWLFTILIAVAVICIIIAGFLFVTAGGSADQVSGARKWLIYAIVGIVIALLARGIVTFLERLI